MEEQLITFETAKLAKEKGFEIPVSNYYNVAEPDRIVTVGAFNHNCKRHGNVTVSAPTQSLLQKWLREKHKIDIRVDPPTEKEGEYNSQIFEKRYSCSWGSADSFDSYEGALEMALLKALTMINHE